MQTIFPTCCPPDTSEPLRWSGQHGFSDSVRSGSVSPFSVLATIYPSLRAISALSSVVDHPSPAIMFTS
ncbi:MAG: hypothetical protein P8105_10020 [Dehalococcoidia bacterium]